MRTHYGRLHEVSVQGKETRNAHRALTWWWCSSMPVLRQLIRMSTWHQEIQVTAGQEVWALRASCCAWLDPRAGTRPLSWWQRTPDTVRLLRKSSWEGWGSTCRCTACKQAVPWLQLFPCKRHSLKNLLWDYFDREGHGEKKRQLQNENLFT